MSLELISWRHLWLHKTFSLLIAIEFIDICNDLNILIIFWSYCLKWSQMQWIYGCLCLWFLANSSKDPMNDIIGWVMQLCAWFVNRLKTLVGQIVLDVLQYMAIISAIPLAIKLLCSNNLPDCIRIFHILFEKVLLLLQWRQFLVKD